MIKPKIADVSFACSSTDKMMSLLFNAARTRYLVLRDTRYKSDISMATMQRVAEAMDDTGTWMAYGDYRVVHPDGTDEVRHTLPYQSGSLREDFDFGPVVVFRIAELRDIIYTLGLKLKWSAFYMTRLFVRDHVLHVPEVLSTVTAEYDADNRPAGQKQFDYVDPRNANVQKEREQALTAFLRRIHALIDPDTLASVNVNRGVFPVNASVIIPVKDRVRTIGDAVRSALAQRPPFSFNVIVVDNNSTDGTSEILDRIEEEDDRVIVIRPDQPWLGIGGCWNLAVNAEECGRFAVQLDSDDLFDTPDALNLITLPFNDQRCGMVVGSYRLTDFDGNPIPPGLIDHREWTDDNGMNNLLRVNGLGAPRAFFTPLIRKIPFPNVSYGEDYAVALRISRQWKIGRVYDCLYRCRRWEGNSDASPSPALVNQHNLYKDWLRSVELSARITLNSTRKDDN